MSNRSSNPQQGKKIELTRSQQNCYEALPEEFVIGGTSDFGQHLPADEMTSEANSANASKRTGKGAPRATRPDDAAKPHSTNLTGGAAQMKRLVRAADPPQTPTSRLAKRDRGKSPRQ